MRLHCRVGMQRHNGGFDGRAAPCRLKPVSRCRSRRRMAGPGLDLHVCSCNCGRPAAWPGQPPMPLPLPSSLPTRVQPAALSTGCASFAALSTVTTVSPVDGY